MVDLQQEYYKALKSKKLSQLWASKTIKNNWTIIYTKWSARNERLHDPPTINKMEGIEILDNAIIQEINLGLNNLPLSEFTHLFKHSSQVVINRSLVMKKSWFTTVRAGRIVYDDTTIQDEFSHRGPL